MKKPVRASSEPTTRVPMPDEEFVLSYPVLTTFLCDSAYDDGSLRERSTLTVFVEDGSIKVALNDRAEARSLYVAAQTLPEALELLERGVNADQPPWRLWPRGRKK